MRAAAPMTDGLPIEKSKLLDPDHWWKAYILAWIPLGLAYLVVLGLFVDIDGSTLLVTWLANVLYPSVVSVGVVWMTMKEIVYRPPRLQIAIHTIGAIAYSALWALTLFRLLQLFNGLLNDDWAPPIWPSAVIAWQLFQGLALYFTVVSGSYAFWALTRLKQNGLDLKAEELSQRIYARSESGLVPISIADIAAVTTNDGATVLHIGLKPLDSRISMSELDALLPSEKFVRVHRTVIVNLDQIQAVEPAGNGRQTVHLQNGLTIETSRAGAAAMKARFAIV